MGNDGVNKWDILGQKCPKNKCDKWKIEPLGNVGGGAIAVAGSIYTKLRAVGEDCCMDEYVNYYNFNALGVGAGFAAGISAAFPPGIGDHEFTTSCITWDDHVGWGNFTGVSGGIFVTVTISRLSTPQTVMSGFSYGVGADLFIGTLQGRWRIKR